MSNNWSRYFGANKQATSPRIYSQILCYLSMFVIIMAVVVMMLNNLLRHLVAMTHVYKLRPYAQNLCYLSMFVIIMAVMGFDIWLLSLWSSGQSSFPLVFLAHSFACSVFLFQAVLCRKLGQHWRFAVFTFPMVLALGPLGAAGMLLTASLYVWYRRTATPFEIWYQQILPEQITPPEEMLIERLRIWGQETEEKHRELVPFTDVLISGSTAEKEKAVDLMVRNYHPIFAGALRGALNDSCNAVRAHAVAAITKIEEMAEAETLLLERRKIYHPDDLDNMLALARHYDEHANSGLSDMDLLAEYRHKAEMIYRNLYAERPDDVSLLWALGRLLVRDKRISDACDIFEKALNASADMAGPMQRIWHWECLYDLHRFKKLREEIHSCPNEITDQISSRSELPQSLLDSIDLWMNDDIKSEALTE